MSSPTPTDPIGPTTRSRARQATDLPVAQGNFPELQTIEEQVEAQDETGGPVSSVLTDLESVTPTPSSQPRHSRPGQQLNLPVIKDLDPEDEQE